MTEAEHVELTRSIPPDLTPEDVITRHGNAMQGPSDPCWMVLIRGRMVHGFYSPEDAAKLRMQILNVSRVKAEYAVFEQTRIQHPLDECLFCGTPSVAPIVCALCVETYQLRVGAP